MVGRGWSQLSRVLVGARSSLNLQDMTNSDDESHNLW